MFPDENLNFFSTDLVCWRVLPPFFLLTDNVPWLCTNIPALHGALGHGQMKGSWGFLHAETLLVLLHEEKLP